MKEKFILLGTTTKYAHRTEPKVDEAGNQIIDLVRIDIEEYEDKGEEVGVTIYRNVDDNKVLKWAYGCYEEDQRSIRFTDATDEEIFAEVVKDHWL